MDSLRIRPARPKDVTAISALLRDLARSVALDPERKPLERLLRGITERALRSDTTADNILYLAGFVGKKLAGVIAIRDKTHIIHLFVAPEFQFRGIARKLWQAAGSACIAAGNHEGFTVEAAPQSVPVFENFGFHATGPKSEKKGTGSLPMRLTLSHGNIT